MNSHKTEASQQERELILAARRNDRAAFKALYDCYRDRVYNLLFYSLGDPLMAEDVLQTVFLKVYRGLPGFRFEASFATWIYRIALNECQNQRRRRGADYVPFEDILGSADECDTAAPPDDERARNERREIIEQAVLELSPKLRAVVVLKYLEGLSYEEMAEALECSPGTVASRLNRALAELEARLRPLKRLL